MRVTSLAGLNRGLDNFMAVRSINGYELYLGKPVLRRGDKSWGGLPTLIPASVVSGAPQVRHTPYPQSELPASCPVLQLLINFIALVKGIRHKHVFLG